MGNGTYGNVLQGLLSEEMVGYIVQNISSSLTNDDNDKAW